MEKVETGRGNSPHLHVGKKQCCDASMWQGCLPTKTLQSLNLALNHHTHIWILFGLCWCLWDSHTTPAVHVSQAQEEPVQIYHPHALVCWLAGWKPCRVYYIPIVRRRHVWISWGFCIFTWVRDKGLCCLMLNTVAPSAKWFPSFAWKCRGYTRGTDNIKPFKVSRSCCSSRVKSTVHTCNSAFLQKVSALGHKEGWQGVHSSLYVYLASYIRWS